MSGDFDTMYSKIGRSSVPPGRVLKSLLLISLYSIRSERAFCQELDCNLLYRWFLDMDLMEPSFAATVFTKNRRRLLRHKVGRKLFEEVICEADRLGLMSDEHFSVDGTLIEAAARIKSFRRRGDAAETVLRDWEDFVSFYDFPTEHWVHLRTTNPLESVFSAVRLRTDAARRMKRRDSALYLVYKVVRRLGDRWRPLYGGINLMKLLMDGARFEDGVLVELPPSDQAPRAA